MADLTEAELMTRAAWLYHVAGMNQAEVARRLGLTRARVIRLLQQARDLGVVSVTVTTRDLGLLREEEAICARYGLDFCLTTPALGLDAADDAHTALRMVGVAAAGWLRDRLFVQPEAVVGIGWGRTLAALARNMTGVAAPNARFVSLMGSLTANSAFNPFDVVQTIAQATGGAAHFLPVPFIANSAEDRRMLLAQQAVQAPLALARSADIALISVGELQESALLGQSGMIDVAEMDALRAAGAVGDTNGLFFDAAGRPVDHALNRRTIAVALPDLASAITVLLSGGPGKLPATRALLASGLIRGLVIDGDSATHLAADG